MVNILGGGGGGGEGGLDQSWKYQIWFRSWGGGGAIAPLDNPLTMAVVVFMTYSLQYSKSISQCR